MNSRRSVCVALGAAWLLSGCTFSDSLRNDPVNSVWTRGGTEARAIAFITDRKPDDAAAYGFGDHWSEGVECGTSDVTVPPARADADGPGATATKPVVQSCEPSYDSFVAAIDAYNRTRNCRRVLLYVHGYNNTFRSALLRTAQIAADAEWPCAAAAFIWGSEAKFDRYVADAERSGYAVPVQMSVLRALDAAGIRTSIIAHSMGARATLGALSALGQDCADHPLVDELILAAPDVNAEKYNDDFAALLRRALPCIHRVTVYASRNDMVLMLSESIHGGIPRAGLEPQSDLKYERLPGDIEVIDATKAPGDPIGHGYFATSYELLDDMMWVLHGVPPARRAEPSLPGGPTLTCENPENGACDGTDDRYALAVAPARSPDWWTRFERRLLARLLAIQ
jgi:esterase/lipase superfamily enzyme